MNCKDCIHFKRCVVLGVELDMPHDKEADKNCRHFKNKANFVEVTKCKDCKYLRIDKNFQVGRYCALRNIYGGGYCNNNDYCSYGEKNNLEDDKK